MLVIKKNKQKTGQGLVTLVVNTQQTHKHAHTYANNKELRRHWVTLETLANKHTCSHAGAQTGAYVGVKFSYKLGVTLTLIKQKETNKGTNKHVRWDV